MEDIMKKFLSMLLALVLVLSVLAVFSACDSDDKKKDDDDKKEAATTTENKVEIPDGYKLYEGDAFSFAYPKSWSVDTTASLPIIKDMTTGNNINIYTEAKTTVYDGLTLERFNSEFVPAYSATGMTVTNASVNNKTTNGISLIEIKYSATMGEINMKQTQFIFTEGESTYTVTVTEVQAVDGLADNVFKTLKPTK